MKFPIPSDRAQPQPTEPNCTQPQPTDPERPRVKLSEKNKHIIRGLNRHFWRRDEFGLVSYPVSLDGRTADASTIREQFGEEGGDGSDGLLYAMLLKAQSKFNLGGDEDTFTGLLDKGLRLIIAQNRENFWDPEVLYSVKADNFWNILELRVIEVLFQENYINDEVQYVIPAIDWGSDIILRKWYHAFKIFGRVQLYDTSYSIRPFVVGRKDPITEMLDERYISQYREYVEYVESVEKP